MTRSMTMMLAGVQGIHDILARLNSEAEARGFPVARQEDMRTAVEEACKNALEHGGASVAPTVNVEWRDGMVGVTVISAGPPFEIPATKPDLHRKIEGDERPRGWGLFLIRSLADTVSVEFRDGINRLRMTFHAERSTQGGTRG